MTTGKLTGAQQAQLAFLETLPPRFERIHRQIEEIAGLKASETQVKALCRLLDECRNHASILSLGPLADTFGMMSMLARRGGGLQMKVRGLREGLVSLKANYDGALRAATLVGDPGPPPEGRSGGISR
ncbi:MAG TPA: hypothetical protein VLL51_06750 [Gemmatimonadales bacterium]|nr:hypothetical protein [Gemmatimonadales bacterium]